MREPSPDRPEKIEFPDRRISGADALKLLVAASGLAEAFLLQGISELRREDLSFKLDWPADHYDDSSMGAVLAEHTRDYIEIRIPEMNVDGTRRCDLSGVNRSYHVNIATSVIRGFPDHIGAKNNLFDELVVYP